MSDAEKLSQQLSQKIFSRIKQEGPITFADYMEMALYTPGLGYYSAGACKFGKAGDFVTAPEISPLFSQCIAKQCSQVLKEMGGSILEIGAGSGVMAVDILKALQKENSLPEYYFIIEPSADLQERQQKLFSQAIPEILKKIKWLTSWPENFCGVILANEVLDAMPVHKFKIMANHIYEFYVTEQDQRFVWQLGEPSQAELIQKIQHLNIQSFPNYESEINLWLYPWIASLAQCLKQGLILLIDYGFPRSEYYHPDRDQGTIMCHYQHQAHSDPLIRTGMQDITAHVDFTAVAEAAFENELEIMGFVHQAGFLLNCGLTDLQAPAE